MKSKSATYLSSRRRPFTLVFHGSYSLLHFVVPTIRARKRTLMIRYFSMVSLIHNFMSMKCKRTYLISYKSEMYKIRYTSYECVLHKC